MVRASLITALAALASLAVAAPAIAQGVPRGKSVEKRVRVPAGENKAVNVYCPRGYVSLGGGVRGTPPGATPTGARPRGARGWRFGFTSLEGSKARTARLVVRCVRLAVPRGIGRARYRVATVNRRYRVAALSAGRVRLSCPAGFAATGYAMQESDGAAQPGLPSPNVQLYAVVPGRSRIVFGLENLGAGDAFARLHVRCVERRMTAGSRSHRLRIRRVGFRFRVRGRKVYTRSCPRGYFSLSEGHAFAASDDTTVGRRFVFGRRSGRWGFDNAGGKAVRIAGYLHCLNLGTRFR